MCGGGWGMSMYLECIAVRACCEKLICQTQLGQEQDILCLWMRGTGSRSSWIGCWGAVALLSA